jgi:hypothetical protein
MHHSLTEGHLLCTLRPFLSECSSIAFGKKADFAALDRDPFRVGAVGLPSLRLEGVIFEGELAAS